MSLKLCPGERVDHLQREGLKIIQSNDAFCFSIDAVLLAHFATVRSRDKVLDLGTGSGVIPLLVSTRAQHLQISGLELQGDAVDRATRSVTLNSLSEQISIIQGDLRKIRDIFPAGYCDVVTCNPPYLPMGTGEVSPADVKKLSRHEFTCTLAEVFNAVTWVLRTGGRFALVHRPERLSEIIRLASAVRLEVKTLRLVHPKAHSQANLILLEAIRNGRPGLLVGPPIFVHNEDGSYTQEIEELYAGGRLR